MEIIQLTVNAFGENTYILADKATGQCAIVDPGLSNAKEEQALVNAIDKYGLVPARLINTHMHVDHVLGNNFVKCHYGLAAEAHKDDEFLAKRVEAQANMFGMGCKVAEVSIDKHLADGDTIKVGESLLQVLSVPGHSPGSICLYCAGSQFVLTGDALFAGSIGRTDLPGGDHKTLVAAINNKLMKLPEGTDVFPGHGPATTIGKEKRRNPYLL